MDLAGDATNESPFGIPDPNTLFASNLVSEFEVSTPREPILPEQDQDAEGGYGMREVEEPGVGSATNQGVVSPPPVQPPPPITPTLVTREHLVVARDTFYTLGKQYGVTVSAIAKANPNVDPNRLQLGQKLIIPPPAATPPAERLPAGVELYQVKSRDTLSSIARTHGTTAAAIRAVNGMTTDRIYAGQKLKLPPKTNATTTTVNP
jgi:LysM repeat protein